MQKETHEKRTNLGMFMVIIGTMLLGLSLTVSALLLCTRIKTLNNRAVGKGIAPFDHSEDPLKFA